LSYYKRKPVWVPGVSDYDGVVPVPVEPILIKEVQYDGSFVDKQLVPNMFCPITLSMGIISGNILVDGHSRAMLAIAGYVMPYFSTEMIFH
jgi:hypothetical protein